ncbi:MAG: LysR substrate-binding domain-containing protein [Edaphobacter sp.]
MEAKIELRHMRSFLAIAEELNFSRAARRSHISQSALSKQMKAVETELGARVFERHTRQVVLTKEGRVFRREATRALEHSRRAISLVQSIVRAETGPIRIGISALCDRHRLQKLLENAERSIDGTSVEIHAGHTAGLVQSVLRGYFDAAIVDLPIKGHGLRVLPIYSEPMLAVLPEKNIFKKKVALTLEDLARVPVALLSQNADPARFYIEKSLRSSSAAIYKIRDAGNLIELLDQVVLEGRSALVRASTQRLAQTGLVYKPLSESPTLECALVWRLDNRRRTLHSFLNTVYSASQATAAS